MASTAVGLREKSIRFGDCELNASAFELRRGRRTVKLERIPVQVLLMLIEQHGKVVTREAIADHIWGKGVFVDVDNGINTAIRKIRQVLNDDPQNPRFVETIAGVGYRFIAQLEPAATPVLVVEPTHDVVSAPSVESASGRTTEGAETRRGWIRTAGILLALLLIAGIAAWFVWRRFTAQQQTIRSIASIAVLPLQNLSGDPSQEYFSDGITDQLITDLAQVGSLRVVSRTSVMPYKSTQKKLPEIGRELNVDAIVEGSVIRSGERVRVTAQLVQAHTDQHLWAETYDRDRGDILKLQADVADAIAKQVRAQLTPTQQARVRPAHPVNPAAYDDYLKGRLYFVNGTFTPDSLNKAQRYFEDSIQKDPAFALAYAGLADSYVYSGYTGSLPRDQAYRSAREALAKAMQLDDGIGEAYDTLGAISSNFDWDWQAAERAFDRAIALAPSYSCAHEDRANFLALMGRRDEALAEIAKIDQLDFGSSAAATESSVYELLRDYPSLIDATRRALLLDPNDRYQRYLLGVGYEGTGRLQEAIPEYQKAVQLSGDSDAVVALAHAYSAVGRKAEAEKMLHDLEQKITGTAGSSLTMAKIHATRGEDDKAFESLERAFSEKTLFMPGTLKADPVLDGLRSDARYQNFLQRMGLTIQ
jgi:TolB-like protein/DNA-binding winged helix-turn-helix (wHTH) protein